MRVALDASHAFDRNPTGVGVYSRRLIEELSAVAPDAQFLLACRANRFGRATLSPKPAANSTRVLLESSAIPLWSRNVELFHGLNQRLPESSFARRVVTFHDLFVMTAEYSTPEFRQRFTEQARDAARRADRIIAVSTHTADQAAELLDFGRRNISVVPHGVDFPAPIPDAAKESSLRDLGIRHPFLLNVGSIQTRKNTERLVEAFERLEAGPMLVLAGGTGFGASAALDRIERSPAKERIKRLGYVDNSTRQLLYQSAAALAFPSLDEGFGIPVLEAMAAGLPVVTSNRSAMPEAAGDAAILVDPLSTDDLRAALNRVLTDESLRSDLTRRGLDRAKKLSWRAAAEATWAVYEELL